MSRALFVLTATVLFLLAGQAAAACDGDARQRTVDAIQSMQGGSSLDAAELEGVLNELCDARDSAVARAEKEDRLDWRSVASADGNASPEIAEQPADASEDGPETTTILGMEFRKAEADSAGRQRLMKKR